MKLPISFVLLAAIGQISSEIARDNKTLNDKTNKRELFEGNYGLRNEVAYQTKYGPGSGIEYAEDNKETSDKSDSIYEERVPQISKISDVLTGQGPPFEVAIANHLYSPVSIYQARLSSPTIFDLPDGSYQDRNTYKQSQQQIQKFQQKTPAGQQKHQQPGYYYKTPESEFTREEQAGSSKLLHLETAFPRLEPSGSAPGQDFPDEVLIQPLSNIQAQLYPQFSFQKIEPVPLRYPDGTLQPIQYYQQSLVNLIPVKSGLVYEQQRNEEETDDGNKEQDIQSSERREEVQTSTEAPTQNYVNQQHSLASYYQNQAYAPSQQYLPIPRPSEQTEDQSLLAQEQEIVQIPQEIQYQQYQQYVQRPEELEPQAEVVQIQQTTPQPIDISSTGPVTISTPSSLPTGSQSETVSTFKPISEFATSPTTILIPEIQTTTLAPHTTHKPLSRVPMVPLRPLPGSRPPLHPRPFSVKQSTTQASTRFTTFAPLPAYRRFPQLNNRRLTSTLQTSPTISTITTTPQPLVTEISSTQSLPSSQSYVSRTPIIRIRHKPSYSTTTPTPTSSVSTTLETLLQPTTTVRPITALEPVSQSVLQSIQTEGPDRLTAVPEYLPPPELPQRPQPGVIYHLQREPEIQVTTSPQPELNPYPQPISTQIQESTQLPTLTKVQPLLQPDIQSVLQPIQAPLQAYPDVVEIDESPRPVLTPSLQYSLVQPTPQTFQFDVPQLREFQPFLRPGVFQLYQPPVFNLRPQYQPISTPLPPTQSTLQHQSPSLEKFETSTASSLAQENIYRAPKLKTKPLPKGGDAYLPPRVLSPIQPILKPQLYSQSRELYIQPDYSVATPTLPSVQYFGKYAEAIFGHLINQR